ncbi:DEAD/DEAH box helicase family protein [Romboutsia lituseburensis]|uniref:DEAD/DEAH box helicase family protein n=1 Tax=Romboutsia lituseburensis TaxID=1537 RepID=UPI00215B55BB|nr:DEAD/DEAH box helicase family protein [Romboutsia lituseburensis]MCR8744267.1 DEAD/DEAH box helicase family protein [Romboutsia lituseburensis]
MIDEAHNAASNTYLNVLNYFTPKFTLGITATPKRSDNNNIFDLFDNNLALEVIYLINLLMYNDNKKKIL